MEDSPEELSSEDLSSIVARAMSLGQRVRDVALDQPEAGSWFALWKPVIAAVIRLARTAGKLLFNLRKIADDDTLDPMPQDLRDELFDDFRDLAADFPDISEVLFGMGNLDTALHALKEDEDTRTLANSLYETVLAVLDRFIDNLIDIVLGTRESSLNPDRILAALGRFERIAQRLLDRL